MAPLTLRSQSKEVDQNRNQSLKTKRATQAQKEASSATPVQKSQNETIRHLKNNLWRKREINGSKIWRKMKLKKSTRIKKWNQKLKETKKNKKMKMRRKPTKRLALQMRMTMMKMANQYTRLSWM